MAVYTQIDNPELYFQIKLWTGNDGSNALTFDGSENMQPEFVWLKPRSRTDNHRLMDSVRTAGKMLPSNSNGAEESLSEFVSFDTDGFTLNTSDAGYNSSSHTYVAWCWKKTATAGFDIVAYTGNATNRTISHSLSAVPKMIFIKNRDSSGGSGEHWLVYHASLGNTHGLFLNQTVPFDDDATYFQDTTPTSSVFSIGTSDRCNKNTEGNIAYLFSEVQGFSKITKVAGNNNNNGPYVWCGFSPSFLLFKEFTSGTNDSWYIIDNKRNTGNPRNRNLRPNNTDDEQAASWLNIDFLSNGYKINDDDAAINESGREYVVLAFAEAPFVNSKGVPNNAR